MSGIQAKVVLKYAIMPGIIPRMKGLFASGFSYIAYLIAQIYGMVRLLPENHPYLNPQNIGLYGIRHVIAESANNLVLSKKNIDQLIIFLLMLTGVVLLAVQLLAIAINIIFGPVLAGPPPGLSMFVTPNPDTDIAFMLLDQVFGVGDGGTGNFFNSCVSNPSVPCPGETASAPFPWPFHEALHNLFQFYSTGILIVGAMIFLYFVVVVVVETATTGTPFGQRFQNIWVPIRLVVALALLVPINYGYNSGQYITFAAAKYGSSFATYAWRRYNLAINANMPAGTGNPFGERENLIALPKQPDATVIVQAMSMLHACSFAHYLHHPKIIKKGTANANLNEIEIPLPETQADIMRYMNTGYIYPPAPGTSNNEYSINAYFVKSPASWMTNQVESEYVDINTTYEDAITFYEGGDIILRFGRPSTDGSYTGGIEPICGDVRIKINDRRETDTSNVHTGGDGYLGSVAVQRFYFQLIRDLWIDTSRNERFVDFAGRVLLLKDNINRENIVPCEMGCNGVPVVTTTGSTGTPTNLPLLPSLNCNQSFPPGTPYPQTPNPQNTSELDCSTADVTVDWKQSMINDLQADINTEMIQIWQAYNTGNLEMGMDTALLERGWGGAGIWFNTMAKLNGNFITSWLDYPALESMPKIMEEVKKLKEKHDQDITGVAAYNPNLSRDLRIQFESGDANAVAKAIGLYSVYEYWHGSPENAANSEKVLTAGALENAMNIVFGTYGLFSMTKENAHVHPLAQLIGLGKGLVEASVRNVAMSTMSAAMGGVIKAADVQAGPLFDAASGFLLSTAFLGLTAGFVLFYIVPFLPFVYFYFAVASWLKTIFEAMVGTPLWALAHLRLDGEGLPGESAANGYFLIFEIFLRPILTVAGLIAAMLIFTTQVRVLHFMWMLVTENIGGFNGDATIGLGGDINFKRSIIDEFFFTVVYAIIVYMLATASFKLIDKIPDNILRWAGQGVSSFGDINQDPTEGLTRYAALGGMTAGQQAAGGVQKLAGGLGGALGNTARPPG